MPAPAGSASLMLAQSEEKEREDQDHCDHVLACDDDRIAFRSFSIGDLALFIRVSAAGSQNSPNFARFLAFNERQPHFYLSEESAMAAGTTAAYVVGRIVLLEERVASADSNPFSLELGLSYHLCTVMAVPDTIASRKSDSKSSTTTPVLVDSSNAKISCANFDTHSICLFFHTGSHECFLAFNCGCPHYYLSKESILSAKSKSPMPAYIFGEVVYTVEKIATESVNPYKLTIGTTYYEVTIAVMGSG